MRGTNRTLTLLGKVLIVNTLVLSPLFYLAPIYPLPTSVERVITRAVFTFIWSGKTELVGRSVLYQPLDKGGLGLTDLRIKSDALFVKGMRCLWDGDGTPWRFFGLYWSALSLRRVFPAVRIIPLSLFVFICIFAG